MTPTDFDEQCKRMAEILVDAEKWPTSTIIAMDLNAHARSFIPLALAKLEEQRADIERLRTQIDDFTESFGVNDFAQVSQLFSNINGNYHSVSAVNRTLKAEIERLKAQLDARLPI